MRPERVNKWPNSVTDIMTMMMMMMMMDSYPYVCCSIKSPPPISISKLILGFRLNMARGAKLNAEMIIQVLLIFI